MFNKKEKIRRRELREAFDKLKSAMPQEAIVETKAQPIEALITIKELEVRTKDIEIKAKGYDSSEVLDLIHAAFGVPAEHFETEDRSENALQFRENLKKGIDVLNRGTSNKSSEKPIDVDMHEIKDKVRLPRTSNNFRCPKCGQAFITNVQGNGKNMWVFRNASSENPVLGTISIEGVKLKSPGDKNELVDLYKALDELTKKQVVLVYKEGETCSCPICGESHDLTEWLDAYTSPLDYFDNEIMCDICGDEGGLVITEKSSLKQCKDLCLSKSLDEELEEKLNA